jgi:hypothetical protein
MASRSIRVFGFVVLLFSLQPTLFAQRLTETTSASAVVPRLITFSGVVRDGKGQLMQGVVGVTLSLYKDQQGGAPLWTENQNVQLDEQGRYSLLLGATQGTGLPSDLFTSGEPRWLGAQAQVPGEEEQPRVLLVSVPYALKAADADTIGGKPVSAFVLAEPGTPSASPQPSNPSTNTLTPTTQRFSSGGGSIQDNGTGTSMTITPSDNIGIGTTTPAAPVEVDSPGEALRLNGAGNTQFSLMSSGTNRQNRALFLDQFGKFQIFNLTSNSSEFVIDSNHQIGVGTASPAGLFHIFSPGPAFSHIEGTSTGIEVGWLLHNDAPLGKQWSIRSTGSGHLLFRDDSTGTPRLTLDSGGNVGIGTETPAAALDVAGDLKVSGRILGALNLNSGTALQINGNPFLSNYGTQNTFVGTNSGNSSVTGAQDTAQGYQALLNNTTGNQNTATGSLALQNNTTGSNNTALGSYAGVTANAANANTTGSNNTFVGFQAGPGSPTQLTNATAIGANAVVSANNTLVLGAPGVSVAIGASTAGYSLDVHGGQINASGGMCINGNCLTN